MTTHSFRFWIQNRMLNGGKRAVVLDMPGPGCLGSVVGATGGFC